MKKCELIFYEDFQLLIKNDKLNYITWQTDCAKLDIMKSDKMSNWHWKYQVNLQAHGVCEFDH